MVDRINLLLKAKNITARQFAEEIGIQPSGMSHILSGRNNPSLDFVMKVVKRWPEVNINWLMFGKGEMFVGLSGSAPEHRLPEIDDHQDNSPTVVSESDPEPIKPSSDDTTPQPQQEYDLFSQPIPQPVRPVTKSQPSAEGVKPETISQIAQAPVSSPASTQKTNPTPASALPVQEQATSLLPNVEQPEVSTPSSDPVHPLRDANPPAQPQLNENRLNEFSNGVALPQANLTKKKIVKIIVLYDDHSFADYFPE